MTGSSWRRLRLPDGPAGILLPALAGGLAGLALAALLVGFVAPAPGPVPLEDLERSRRRPSYRLVTGDAVFSVQESRGLISAAVGEMQADEAPQVVIGDRIGVVGHRLAAGSMTARWQMNVPVGFDWQRPCAWPHGMWDVDRDGDREVVVTSGNQDGSRWLLWALDAAGGLVGDMHELPGGPDHRPDGRWDGGYGVLGLIDVPTARGPRLAYAVAVTALFDREPRGVLALDVATGEILWRYLVGPKVWPQWGRVADLDGDGSAEVVFAGAAVNNLQGRRVGLYSDDTCAIFALDAVGDLLWHRVVAEGTAHCEITPVDLDHDGASEIVGIFQSGAQGGIIVLDGGSGDEICSLPMPGLKGGIVVGPLHGGDLLVAAKLGNGVRIVRLRGTTWEIGAEAVRSGSWEVLACEDILPEVPGPELALRHAEGRVVVADTDLQVHAATDASYPWVDSLEVVHVPGAGPVLVPIGANYPLHQGPILSLQPTVADAGPPPGVMAVLPLAGAGLGALVGGALRRRMRGSSRYQVREARLALLARLEFSNHGAIGSLRTLRRLTWHLDSLCQQGDVTEHGRRRLHELADEVFEQALPSLRRSLALAEQAEASPHRVAAAAEALTEVAQRLARLRAAGFPPAAVAAETPALRQAAAEADIALRRIRLQVSRSLRCDLDQVIQRVAAAHEEELRAADVELVVTGRETERMRAAGVAGVAGAIGAASAGGAAGAAGTGGAAVAAGIAGAAAGACWCQMDEEELAFIVDNLVENAGRAVRNVPVRRIVIDCEQRHGMVLLRVRDTGCGIIPDDWERIFDREYSSREDGGLGLARSRELLAKYGGRLEVAESRPGEGTTLLLAVRAAEEDAISLQPITPPC
ncbi:MAG: sensor histidine kinase [Candidatus Krumholzibacteriia bacterium]